MVLFYNGISKYGKEKLYPLICKYAILEQLDTNSLMTASNSSFYPPAAWADEIAFRFDDTAIGTHFLPYLAAIERSGGLEVPST
jgi:hypothetical protein